MKTHEIRELFLAYFAGKAHQIVPSSALVPQDDPSLLFTNAGMVPFKAQFLGQAPIQYPRATSVQRCVRAGGKHNDLDNVGYTARHHTFFEMLGNFSFGDYFKSQAIFFAWDFLTQVLKLPAEKLWVTVYTTDETAAQIWLNEIGIAKERLVYCGEEDNFWSMGDTGPCGPCTEIFYDHGPSVAGGPPGSPEAEGDRFVEVWNLVFMAYNRDKQGKLTPLPNQSVDTGMGLERIAAVMQGVSNNYDIDLFKALLAALVDCIGVTDTRSSSMRVIVDHIRACAFLILDGVIPGNEGRSYVLRRILRRAVRHGRQLGQAEPFFYKMVAPLADQMGETYPELRAQSKRIAQIIHQEELQFFKTLDRGLVLLENSLRDLKGTLLPGSLAFTLYDTYGFPLDLTADVLRERGFQVDKDGFFQAMALQKKRSKQNTQFEVAQDMIAMEGPATVFSGYEKKVEQALIVQLISGEETVSSVMAPCDAYVVLDRTPFYPQGGGQVGDPGIMLAVSGARFKVTDTQKQGEHIVHIGRLLEGVLSVSDSVEAQVSDERDAVACNHSATHLLHQALQDVLGAHIVQKGSHVTHDRLRFDFSHPKAVTLKELQSIEVIVNREIRANHALSTVLMTVEQAKEQGAMALFGEKYSEKIRVVSMGGFSKEICGGTHVARTGAIGTCLIMHESAVAAGVRRIEAVTGETALLSMQSMHQTCYNVSQVLQVPSEKILDKIELINKKNRQLEQQIQKISQSQVSQRVKDLIHQAVVVGPWHVVVGQIPAVSPQLLRQAADNIKAQLAPVVVVLASTTQEKTALVSAVSKPSGALHAGKIVSEIAQQMGGRAGGRPDFAQGGVTGALDLAQKIPDWQAAIKDLIAKHQQSTEGLD